MTLAVLGETEGSGGEFERLYCGALEGGYESESLCAIIVVMLMCETTEAQPEKCVCVGYTDDRKSELAILPLTEALFLS